MVDDSCMSLVLEKLNFYINGSSHSKNAGHNDCHIWKMLKN